MPAIVRRVAGSASLLLICPALALGEAPQTSPLPRQAPVAEAVAGAPERAPLPVPRPGEEPPEPAAAPAAAVAPEAAPEPAPSPDVATEPEPAPLPEPPAAEAAPAATEDASPYAVAASPLPPPRPGLKGSTLIGIFSLTTGRTALLRFPSGDVIRLSVGDTIDGWEVSAIASDGVRLTRDGRDRTFPLVGN